MTRTCHERSFLAFGCDVIGFVAGVEAAYPPTPVTQMDVDLEDVADWALADANQRFRDLLHCVQEAELERMAVFGVMVAPEVRAYAESVAQRHLLAWLMISQPSAPTERDILVQFVAGAHCAIRKSRADTARVLNVGIPRCDMAQGYTPSLVRNALDSFVKPLAVPKAIALLPSAVDLAAAQSRAVDTLWCELGGAGKAPAALSPLCASGEILPRYRTLVAKHFAASMRRPAINDVSNRAIRVLRSSLPAARIQAVPAGV